MYHLEFQVKQWTA